MNKSVKWFLQGFMLFVANTRPAHADVVLPRTALYGDLFGVRVTFGVFMVEDMCADMANYLNISRTRPIIFYCNNHPVDTPLTYWLIAQVERQEPKVIGAWNENCTEFAARMNEEMSKHGLVYSCKRR